jgi:hypothetical protein
MSHPEADAGQRASDKRGASRHTRSTALVIQEFRQRLLQLRPEDLSEADKAQLRGLLRELQALIQLTR